MKVPAMDLIYLGLCVALDPLAMTTMVAKEEATVSGLAATTTTEGVTLTSRNGPGRHPCLRGGKHDDLEGEREHNRRTGSGGSLLTIMGCYTLCGPGTSLLPPVTVFWTLPCQGGCGDKCGLHR